MRWSDLLREHGSVVKVGLALILVSLKLDSRTFRCSQREIAVMANVSPAMVQKSIYRLKALGLLATRVYRKRNPDTDQIQVFSWYHIRKYPQLSHLF